MRNVFFLLLFYSLTYTAFAQEEVKPRPSPNAIVTMKYEDTYIKVTYCQPHMRGRNVFGELVPYGEVWRTGANEATEITLTNNILLNGNELKAGTYSIFTIPYKDKWTIIINKGLGMWGAYNYTPDQDVMRFDVEVEKLENISWEAFTISFEQNSAAADLTLVWDKIKVNIPIKFLEIMRID